jgi:hypothetical protein
MFRVLCIEKIEKKMSKLLAYSDLDYSDIDNFIK